MADLEGLDLLLKALRKLPDDIGEVKRVNKESAEIVLDEAKSRSPFQSGALRKSGRASGTKKSGVVRFGSKRVPYAGPIHFGHADRYWGGSIKPNPFIYDSADRRVGEVRDRYQKHTEDVLRKSGLT